MTKDVNRAPFVAKNRGVGKYDGPTNMIGWPTDELGRIGVTMLLT